MGGGAEHDGALRIDRGGQYEEVISISSVLEMGSLYCPGPTRRYIVPPNSTSNSAKTSSKNTIFLRGFGTIQGTIRGTIFIAEEFFFAKETPSSHCHCRRRTAATSAAMLPPPPLPPLAPLPPLVPPEYLLPCPCPLCRRRFHLHPHCRHVIVAVSIAVAVATFS